MLRLGFDSYLFNAFDTVMSYSYCRILFYCSIASLISRMRKSSLYRSMLRITLCLSSSSYRLVSYSAPFCSLTFWRSFFIWFEIFSASDCYCICCAVFIKRRPPDSMFSSWSLSYASLILINFSLPLSSCWTSGWYFWANRRYYSLTSRKSSYGFLSGWSISKI